MDPYEFNTQAYKESEWRPDDPRVQRILPLVGNNQTVLDLGCLDGTIGELFVKNGNTVYAIDASKSALPRAIERGIKAELGNLEEPLKYEDKVFDVVFAGEIVEHVFDIDSLLSEIHRVLKDDGSMVLTTPNLGSLGRRLSLLVNKNPHMGK